MATSALVAGQTLPSDTGHWSQDLLDTKWSVKGFKTEVCSPLGQINCVKNLLEFSACAGLRWSFNCLAIFQFTSG